MKKTAGILLPVFSLPSEYGIGCFGKTACEFIDFLSESGQSFWQILPLGPTGYGDSPYQSFGAFAGNPYFIDLNALIEENLLTKKECDDCCFENNGYINYTCLYQKRLPLLKKAFKRSHIRSSSDYLFFCQKNQWLDSYALFMALKEHFNGVSWNNWKNDIKMRNEQALNRYREILSEEIEFHKFLQYMFYRQWNKLKEYANRKNIKIIGDIPIYVAFDSADVWANPDLFQLDENLLPKAVAGCPPDGFSADGQLWGNPLYNWKYHRETDYSWWISKLEHCFNLYDVVRIDHFRGFDEYYSIPYGDTTAKNGHWEKGPGIELFRAIENAIGKKEIIAEDLGFMTKSVKKLVKESGFPNMKVIEFAFDSRDTGSRNDYLPHNYNENCIAYTGTHDNQTIISWFESISDDERNMARNYLCDKYTPNKKINSAFISLIMRSNASVCIIPIQDWLGLDDKSRINTPSTLGNNWNWRLDKKHLNENLRKEILEKTTIFGRI